MDQVLHFPVWVFAISFVTMWLASVVGLWVRNRDTSAGQARSEDFDIITAGTLSLLALIIGFTFSMAASRYDERKILEEAEANAIGTEYLRADLLPASDAARVRTLLRAYLDQRILFFTYSDARRLARINQQTNQLEDQLWAAVRAPAIQQPTPVAALVVAGMNDVINSQGYTQAAIWNRIPKAAWYLLGAIAVLSNALLGYGARDLKGWRRLGLVLPLAVAVSFLLIADIDAPRHGLIRVEPVNLKSLAQSLGR